MTSPITFPCWIIGLMSGTSADGVDAALLYTDGEKTVKTGASLFVPYHPFLRARIFAAMQKQGDIQGTAHELTAVHVQAVEQLIATGGVPREEVKLLGFHGQTVLHRPKEGFTVQIGEPHYLAEKTGIPVVYDFRTNDMLNGGEGAPLVPLYHAALAANLPQPLMVVNIGGVANVTYIDGDTIIAFDCGPGNALLDDWVNEHTGERCDAGGALAARGTVHQELLAKFLANPFFEQPVPKSLDRNHFSRAALAPLSAADGAATLTAMTCAAIAEAVRAVPKQPLQLLVCGGGRHNATMMDMLKKYQLPAMPVETVGWNGDMLEAEAFAYLAARSLRGLPLSLPSTTGVHQPVTGGALCLPQAG